MSSEKLPLQIPSYPAIHINRDIRVQPVEDLRVILVRGIPLLHYSANDRPAEALAIAHLRRAGLAKATELARAFGKSRNTVAGYHRRLEQQGVTGLAALRRGPRGPHKLTAPLERTILKLKAQGLPNTQIAVQVGVSEFSIRRLLKQKGRVGPNVDRQARLLGLPPHGADACVNIPSDVTVTGDVTAVPRRVVQGECGATERQRPVHEAVERRVLERALAAVGLLHEASPELVAGQHLRCVGVFVAIPLLLQMGLLEVAESVYGSLKKGFYGLRATMLTLFLMGLLRIKSPEGLKRHPPEVLGRLLGLDRSPEVKTLRRKLCELAQRGLAHEFVREMARRIVRDHEEALGYLYVDGHVREYHGRRKIPKTKVPKRRMILPATTDYWVNDAHAEPLFFITTEGNPFLNRAFPRVLDEVKELVGKRPVTFIFDRGGWSAELFRTIHRDYGYDFLTYRKQPYRDFPRTAFARCEFHEQGRRYERWLADRSVRLKGFGLVRCVARWCDNGHQTHMVTTRKDLSREEVARRMFRRWRQENFFKYMTENYALDALVSYDLEPANADRETSNPARNKLTRELRTLRNDLAEVHQRLGELDSPTGNARRRTRPDSPSNRATLTEDIQTLQEKIKRLRTKRRELPTRIQVRDLPVESQVRLEVERKTLTDTVKMMAYRAESALLNLIAPNYRRAEQEGRQLIQEIMHASGDVEVDRTHIAIRLEPLSSLHRTRVLEKLCLHLTEQRASYPGTKQPLQYEVRPRAQCTVST